MSDQPIPDLVLLLVDARAGLTPLDHEVARRLRSISQPVILVCNKSDDPEEADLGHAVEPLMDEFPQIETCVACSTLNTHNIDAVFEYARTAVLYPSAPLRDPATDRMQPACEAAMKRIFALADQDHDGLLHDPVHRSRRLERGE